MDYMPTLKDLIQDLQLAKEISIKNGNANSLINAVMAQARLLGFTETNHQSKEVLQLSQLIDELSEV